MPKKSPRQIEYVIGTNGQSIKCWSFNKTRWFTVDAWTWEEANRYTKTGRYPKRLAKQIQSNFMGK